MSHYSNKTQKRTIKEKNHKVGFQKNVKLFLKKLKKEKKRQEPSNTMLKNYESPQIQNVRNSKNTTAKNKT